MPDSSSRYAAPDQPVEERLARIYDELVRRGYDVIFVELAWGIIKPAKGKVHPTQPLWQLCLNVQHARGLIYFRNLDGLVAVAECESWLGTDLAQQQLGPPTTPALPAP